MCTTSWRELALQERNKRNYLKECFLNHRIDQKKQMVGRLARGMLWPRKDVLTLHQPGCNFVSQPLQVAKGYFFAIMRACNLQLYHLHLNTFYYFVFANYQQPIVLDTKLSNCCTVSKCLGKERTSRFRRRSWNRFRVMITPVYRWLSLGKHFHPQSSLKPEINVSSHTDVLYTNRPK